jgi:hypothetical protein
VGEPEQLRIANYRMKEIEFPLSVTNAFALSGKTSSHYAFLVMTVASFALSLCALVLCLRTRGLRRKRWWVLFIVFGSARSRSTGAPVRTATGPSACC